MQGARTRRINRRTSAQALIETAVASIFIVPIALAMLDVGVIVYLNIENDSIAKNAARAAANQPNFANAEAAANRVFTAVKLSNLVNSCTMNFDYNGESTFVTSTMNATLPVPVAGFGHPVFVAKAVQPVVAVTK